MCVSSLKTGQLWQHWGDRVALQPAEALHSAERLKSLKSGLELTPIDGKGSVDLGLVIFLRMPRGGGSGSQGTATGYTGFPASPAWQRDSSDARTKGHAADVTRALTSSRMGISQNQNHLKRTTAVLFLSACLWNSITSFVCGLRPLPGTLAGKGRSSVPEQTWKGIPAAGTYRSQAFPCPGAS